MKILTRKQQEKIAQELAVIFHDIPILTATADFDKENKSICFDRAVRSLAELAYLTGGLNMMARVPNIAAKISQRKTDGEG